MATKYDMLEEERKRVEEALRNKHLGYEGSDIPVNQNLQKPAPQPPPPTRPITEEDNVTPQNVIPFDTDPKDLEPENNAPLTTQERILQNIKGKNERYTKSLDPETGLPVSVFDQIKAVRDKKISNKEAGITFDPSWIIGALGLASSAFSGKPVDVSTTLNSVQQRIQQGMWDNPESQISKQWQARAQQVRPREDGYAGIPASVLKEQFPGDMALQKSGSIKPMNTAMFNALKGADATIESALGLIDFADKTPIDKGLWATGANTIKNIWAKTTGTDLPEDTQSRNTLKAKAEAFRRAYQLAMSGLAVTDAERQDINSTLQNIDFSTPKNMRSGIKALVDQTVSGRMATINALAASGRGEHKQQLAATYNYANKLRSAGLLSDYEYNLVKESYDQLPDEDKSLGEQASNQQGNSTPQDSQSQLPKNPKEGDIGIYDGAQFKAVKGADGKLFWEEIIK